jgi:predicted pyridoxine 5'-phosphate oxidase superfamily flavin-nucleotide-binding protein
MGNEFGEIVFTPTVKGLQEELGSRKAYASLEAGEHHNNELGPDESDFIAERDSFYMASVSETDWPYVQHRGGPAGFVKILDSKTLGFADFRGNRQYVSVGNLTKNDRVALFFMDYPHRTRLKLLGHAELVGIERTEVLESLAVPGYKAKVERGMLIHVAAFDWNCPQHITPRFTQEQVQTAVEPLRQRIAQLEAQLAAATGGKSR